MRDSDRDDGVNRRKVLECMTWVGTGVLWTIAGGVPHSPGIMGEAAAQETKGLTFLQISDSHVGFDKPANPNALGTLQEAVSKIIALPQKPAFMIHTGDISHLSLESQFDDADRIISQTKLDVHYVPGEHDFLDPEQKFYRERYGRGTKGAGWYSFDANGVHFIGLVNVVDLKAGGLGNLGGEQLEWLEDDLKGKSKSTPIVLFAPSGAPDAYYAEFGWVPAAAAAQKVPGPDTVWKQEGGGALTADHPVTLSYDNGDGLIFRRTIAVDDHYLFTIRDEVQNKSGSPVTLFPYGLISRHGTPKVLGYYILHEGLIGVMGNEGLQEETYKKIEDKKNESWEVTNAWLGFTDKYWAAALLPDTDAKVHARFSAGESCVPNSWPQRLFPEFRSLQSVVFRV